MKLLLAVSGGIDSMYLANRASELYPGASFDVAHCNFRLRGEESDGDEAFVREWCDSHGIRCHVRSFDTAARATETGKSVEMTAREQRYGWFSELCGKEGFDAVVVAHNANDNAETMILNLLRGTGTKGVRGMAAESVRDDGLKILRPMLGLSRREIQGWMSQRGLKWREDSTNAESVVKRNLLRNEVFPLFERINPSFLQTLSADMERFSQVDDIADDYYRNSGVADDVDGVPVDRLLNLEHWEYVLWRALERCGLSQATFGKLVDLLGKYKSRPKGTVTLGSKVFESPTHTIRIEKGRILIKKNYI